MVTLLQALAIAAIQGATELFPVSSLGHAVLLPWLFNWHVDQRASAFLPFLVMLHLGTAVALFVFFWRTWRTLIYGVLGLGSMDQTRANRRVVVLIVLATIPAVMIGGLLEHSLRRIFAVPMFASAFLIGNGVMLLLGDRLRSRVRTAHVEQISEISMKDALIIGLWQCLALLPGLSRSGATMVGGLLRGLNHEVSAHFSFLIALPIILAATVKEVPQLIMSRSEMRVLEIATVSAAVAGVVAFASTAFLMRYFRLNDGQAFRPFALYCILIGGATFIFGFVRA